MEERRAVVVKEGAFFRDEEWCFLAEGKAPRRGLWNGFNNKE